jgi:hypothetical protein
MMYSADVADNWSDLLDNLRSRRSRCGRLVV